MSLYRYIVSLLLLAALPASAQTEAIYLMEVGGGVGVATYEGDFNSSIMRGGKPMVSFMLRRLIDPYQGFRLSLGYNQLGGSSKNADAYYPEYQQMPYEFRTNLINAGVAYEYNFWPYGTGREYRGAQPFTPFIIAGIGMNIATCDGETHASMELPLGMGFKYKLAPRVNLGLEWIMHFTQNDYLDGLRDPLSVKSSGLFKNTDCYSVLQLSLTYSFMAKCRTCHKDGE